MSKRVTYFNSSRTSLLNPLQIFGTDLYEWWDFTDLSTQVITGGLIDQILSKGVNARLMVATGTERPASIIGTNGLPFADFDGVNDYMQVLGSTFRYNFMHDGSLGTSIFLAKFDAAAGILMFGNNQAGTPPVGWSSVAGGVNGNFSNNISRGVTGTRAVQNLSASALHTSTNLNMFMFKVDADNVTAADRSIMSVNGGAEQKNNIQTFAPSLANATFNLNLGRDPVSGGFFFDGKIPEVMLLTTHPTPTQITQLNAYLTNKYGGTFPII